ncbi:MAG: hypothetical protein Q7S20_07235 [Gemmatimonadaceae bacterium]|nr:hypothetical protein [Gemmatimonadaceae bacterium]
MMRLPMRFTLVALAVGTVTLGGCGGLLGRGGGSPREYQITINRQAYNRGNTGEATIRNASDKTLEYNLCQRRLERDVNKYWVVAFEWPTAGGACTSETRTLTKGTSVNTLFDIPTGVPTGTYRVVFTGLLGEDGRTVSSDRAATPSFAVR